MEHINFQKLLTDQEVSVYIQIHIIQSQCALGESSCKIYLLINETNYYISCSAGRAPLYVSGEAFYCARFMLSNNKKVLMHTYAQEN